MEQKVICPYCGDLLDSFTGKCKSCGAEIYRQESQSIKDFSIQLSQIGDDWQKIELIKTYPIPNTKQDIMEYLILASSNIGYKNEKTDFEIKYEEAWITKFYQGYQKAKLVYERDTDFVKIQDLYNMTMMRLSNLTREKDIKNILRITTYNIWAELGVIAGLVAVIMDLCKKNAAIMELLAVVFIIIAASIHAKRKSEVIDYVFTVIGSLCLIILSFGLSNGSMLEAGGVVALIVVAVNYIKGLKKR